MKEEVEKEKLRKKENGGEKMIKTIVSLVKKNDVQSEIFTNNNNQDWKINQWNNEIRKES